MIDEDRLQKALTYLATTDEPCAALRADMERSHYRAKAIRAAMIKHSSGSSASAREADADSSNEVNDAWEKAFKAAHDYYAMNNKRDTEKIVIDTWRSLNSNRRMGQV
jgi:hypothetical protein